MGVLSSLRLASAAQELSAQYMPYTNPAVSILPRTINSYAVSRDVAMAVPAIARARDTICNTIASLPLELWSETGQKLQPYGWQNQPDEVTPRSVTLAWLIDSLLFYGVGYVQVTNVYAEDGRPRNFTWIDPLRVEADTNNAGTRIVSYMVDGRRVPNAGIGSLITFQAPEEGILARGGRTIATLAALETAALNAAQEPVPMTVIKNVGMDLDPDQVDSILAQWKLNRTARSTAYMSGQFDVTALGFSAREMQLVEARQYAATEAARLTNLPAWALDAPSGDSNTYSNNVDRRKDLLHSLRGWYAAVEDRMTMRDFTAAGQYVRFGLDDFLRENSKERAEVLAILLTNGIITVEEARAKEGLSPRGN